MLLLNDNAKPYRPIQSFNKQAVYYKLYNSIVVTTIRTTNDRLYNINLPSNGHHIQPDVRKQNTRDTIGV